MTTAKFVARNSSTLFIALMSPCGSGQAYMGHWTAKSRALLGFGPQYRHRPVALGQEQAPAGPGPGVMLEVLALEAHGPLAAHDLEGCAGRHHGRRDDAVFATH